MLLLGSDHGVADGRGAAEASTEWFVPAGVHRQLPEQKADAAHRHPPSTDQEPTAAAGCEWIHISHKTRSSHIFESCHFLP